MSFIFFLIDEFYFFIVIMNILKGMISINAGYVFNYNQNQLSLLGLQMYKFFKLLLN